MRRILLALLSTCVWTSSQAQTASSSPNQAFDVSVEAKTNNVADLTALLQLQVANRLNTARGSASVLRSTNAAASLSSTEIDLADGSAMAVSNSSVLEEIQITGDGAVAQFGPHKVEFAGSLNAQQPVRLQVPGSGILRSRVLGLCYYSPESGESVLIADLKSVDAELVSSNQIVYRDALEGISADLVYTYTRASLEQDLIIRKQLPTPVELGLKATNVCLGLMTEFFNAPLPRKIPAQIEVGVHLNDLRISITNYLTDETLVFGTMKIVQGRAFSLPDSDEIIPVGKSWQVLDGRQFLIESTPLAMLEDESHFSGYRLRRHLRRRRSFHRHGPDTFFERCTTQTELLAIR